ncbi:MAG: TSUP family transporter [Woeseiaceae bacterium]|nr:TSUP family transporter [Woeseiaceae bacterium]
MDLPSLVVAMLITGAAAGVLAGLLGVGGGIVIVPALEIALQTIGVDAQVRMHIAVGTSLAVIIPTSISSAAAHYRRDAIDFDVIRFWSPLIFAGAIIGAVVAAQVSGRVLYAVFSIVALLVAANMMWPGQGRTVWSGVPRDAVGSSIPVGIGFISTLMGIGGGSMSVPAMTLMGRSIHRAVGTSSLLGLVIAVPAATGYGVAGWGNELTPAWSVGYVSLIGLAFIAPTTILFAPVGARIAHALSHRWLSGAFGAFLLAVAIRMGFKALA